MKQHKGTQYKQYKIQ